MKCPRCQHDNPIGQKFCGECGTPLKSISEAGPPVTSYADLQRDLTEALEQQTATSEILRVISSSPTDVQPVFGAIVRSAMRLLGGFSATLRQLAGDQLDLVAFSTTGVSATSDGICCLPSQHLLSYAARIHRSVYF